QASGQQLVAHFAKVVVPSQLAAKARGAASVRCEHQLQVLQMVRSGAGADFGEHVRGMAVASGSKLSEGRKEVIVAGFARRKPAAHGEGVQQLVVQSLVLVGGTGRRPALVTITRRRNNR